jgi:hypothetical protein
MIGFSTVKNPINYPFALTLYSSFLTRMRITLGALDPLSRAYRPSRAVHQSVSPRVEVSCKNTRGQCYIDTYLKPKSSNMTVPAYAMQLYYYNNDRLPQSSTGSSLPPEGLRPFRLNSRFAGHKFRTAKKSLSPSCGSTFNRQGTTLP